MCAVTALGGGDVIIYSPRSQIIVYRIIHAWGNDMVETIIHQYGKDKEHKYKLKSDHEFKISKSRAKINPHETRDEWRGLKQTVLQQLYSRDNMKQLWSLITQFHKEEFPNMIKLAYYAITQSTHTSDCERSFSNQNGIITAQRNRLCPENIDKIMRIQIQRPVLGLYNFIPPLARWRYVRCRYIFKV